MARQTHEGPGWFNSFITGYIGYHIDGLVQKVQKDITPVH